MTVRGTRFELARVTIEFTTPLRVGAGGWDPLHDAFFATDANDLPAIPGTSIAGVLRHAASALLNRDEVWAVFGFQERGSSRASRLETSWGQVHARDDRPVPFLGAHTTGDAVLALLSGGVVRDHVRIDARGTSDEENRGKFDELVVPAGARFTFELVLHDGSGHRLAEILGWLEGPSIRLGAGSRKGLGRFRVVRALGRSFDLRLENDRAALRRLPADLHEPMPSGVLSPLPAERSHASARWRTGTLVLEPEDYWMIGGGNPGREEHVRNRKGRDAVAKAVPIEMPRVVWGEDGGRVDHPAPVVPASAVKGALRHRLAWHLRKQSRQFWSTDAPAVGEETDPGHLPGVVEVFGSVKDGEAGRPGRVLLSDGRVEGFQWGWLDHVSLDRFTQGPMDHLLFSEAPLYRGKISLDLAIDVQGLGDEARVALDRTLRDLTTGALPIGAGANRGHGVCRGRIDWTDGRGLT